jgi:hypothetical protein
LVTLTIDPVDDASDDVDGTNEDTLLAGDVSMNDTFGSATTYSVNTGVTHGTLVLNTDGSFTYDPDADYNGGDGFTYDVIDINGFTETQLVTLMIDPIDDAADDSETTDEDTQLVGDVSVNDTFSAAAAYSLNTGTSNGTVIVNADGTFTYTPHADYNGGDSFTYDVLDINGFTETQLVTLTIGPVDDATDDSGATDEDTLLAGNVSTNDSFGAATTYSVNTTTTNGALVFNADGTFTYAPDADYNGADSFTYDVVDVNGATETQTVTLTINPFDDAVDDIDGTDEDTLLAGDVSTNDTFGAAATYSVNTTTTNGALVFNVDGTYTYTPDADYNGTDSFTYDVADINSTTETRLVTLTINPMVDMANAGDDSITTIEDTSVVIDAAYLLSNDTDADGDSLSIASVGQPANGALADNGDGTYTYTPALGFIGTDTFTYEVTDGSRYDADFNDNGVVDSNDASVFFAVFGTAAAEQDFNGNGVVDSNDASIFFMAYGSGDALITDTAEVTITVADAGSALIAATAPAPDAVPAAALVQEDLDAVVDAAIDQWLESGILSAEQTAILNTIDAQIIDLSGSALGLATDDTLYIDIDAAGYGWFIDTTPERDEEFHLDPVTGQLTATSGGGAGGQMDLLSVVMHELGHVLGLEHEDSGEVGAMVASLDVGTRLVFSVDLQNATKAHVGDGPVRFSAGTVCKNSDPLFDFGQVCSTGVLYPQSLKTIHHFL